MRIRTHVLSRQFAFVLWPALLLCAVGFAQAQQVKLASVPVFRITVVDEETGRGIPAVLLKLTNTAEYWTDNNGVVAFMEPDLMNQRVYFEVGSHGYKTPELGGGWGKGVIVETKPGGSAVIKLHRENIAQRLYRYTGSGMYRDSILLGDKVPATPEADQPPVMGQDGGDGIIYKGKLYWFWGDTGIPRFFLGVYRGTSATSELPGKGGLDPGVGIALRYLRNQEGEAKPIVNLPGAVYWYRLPRVCRDKKGQEHLVANYAQIRGAGSMEVLDDGVMQFDDKAQQFELVANSPKDPAGLMRRDASSHFRYTENGKEHFYLSGPYPCVRWPVVFEAQTDPSVREAFTCLKQGTNWSANTGAADLDRDAKGNLRWAWKRNTSAVAEAEMNQLVKSGAMTDRERWYGLKDVNTGATIMSQHGSVFYNPYRKRWISIRLQMWGETLVGEAWYLEGDTPQGPWVYAQKIITHNWKGHTSSFYMTSQLPFFDKDGGRIIYLKGSFGADFGDVNNPTPRHTYNMMMYKLVLDDSRLYLPVPVYRVGGKITTYRTKNDIPERNLDRTPVFFAPDRPRKDTVPVYQYIDRRSQSAVLTLTKPADPKAKIAFYALPADAKGLSEKEASVTRPLYEFRSKIGHRVYTTEETYAGTKGVNPICRVWENPYRFNPYALGAR